MALPAEPHIPEWSLGDRLEKALDESPLSVAAMALRLGVSRQTVGNYMAGRSTPKRAALRVWAEETNVSLHWLLGDDACERCGGTGVTGMTCFLCSGGEGECHEQLTLEHA